MNLLQSLRFRTEGCESNVDYDSYLTKLRCTCYNAPPLGFVESRLLSCAFAKKEKHGHILAVTCEEGQIIILNTQPSNSNSYTYDITNLGDDRDAIFSVSWSEIDMKLITTSGDHAVGYWSLRDDCGLVKLNSYKAHRCTVKTACFKPQSSDVFASGGRDGNIYVWDSRKPSTSEPEQYINNCHKKVHKKNENSSITCIIYQDEFKLISCADADNNINVWDLRKTYLRTTDKPIPVYQLPSVQKKCLYGYTHMLTDRNRTKLYANSFSHKIYCYNISGYVKTPEIVYSGHSVRNFFAKLSISPDDKYIASTDSDDCIFIWKLRSPEKPIVKLFGDSDMLIGLSDVSWCPEDPLKFATSSDYPSPWIWTVPPVNEDAHDNVLEKVSFAESSHPIRKKCRRNSAMVSKLPQNRKSPHASLSPFKLPNSVIDGSQIHTCCVIEKRPSVISNWFTNLQNQKIKSSSSEAETKSPSPASNNKKRKRVPVSPGNNLIKYFKKCDKNSIS